MEYSHQTPVTTLKPGRISWRHPWILNGVILVAVILVILTYLKHGDPFWILITTFALAPFFILTTEIKPLTGCRLIALSAIPVLIAMYFLSVVYFLIVDGLGLSYMLGFLVIIWILAPIGEELIKGSMYLLAPGGWKHGILVGCGFGLFESAAYQMHFSDRIYFLRFTGIALHATTTALFFIGMESGKRKYLVGAILLHIAFNSLMPLMIYYFF